MKNVSRNKNFSVGAFIFQCVIVFALIASPLLRFHGEIEASQRTANVASEVSISYNLVCEVSASAEPSECKVQEQHPDCQINNCQTSYIRAINDVIGSDFAPSEQMILQSYDLLASNVVAKPYKPPRVYIAI